jgi:hypothetical protein
MAAYLVGGISLLSFGVMVYAISRGRDVKASLKIPFALFSFETKETRREPGIAKRRD